MLNKNITQAKAYELFNYDSRTGLLTNKTQRSSGSVIGALTGSKDSDGYLRTKVDGKEYKVHRLIWLYFYGYLPETDIDHIDRIRHHNWIGNLREASRQCNIRNSGNRKDNTSGIKGVYWDKDRQKCRARIMVNRKHINIGSYDDFTEAVCHRLAMEQCLNWDGCDSSSPAYKYVKNLQTQTGGSNV